MKKLIIILAISIITSFAFSKTANAATPSATPDATISAIPTTDDTKLKKLLDNVNASLKKKDLISKRGIIGTVTDVSETQITITDLQNTTRFIDVDEITKFESSDSTKTSFGISDITKGTTIGAFGLYNKESQHLLARFVDALILPQFVNGVITDIDSKNFNLTITTVDKPTLTISVETSTKTYSYTKDTDLVKTGFSKIITGERISVVGFTDLHDKNIIIASRIYLFPDLPKNPNIKLSKPVLTSTSTPTPTKPK